MKKKLLLLLLSVASISGFSQNNYLDFDGVNDNVFVTGSENILSGSSTISMSCKVYPKNANPSFPAFDGFAGYRNDSNFDFYIIQLSSSTIEARFRNSSGVAYTLTYSGLVLNQWNHFFLVYNGSYLSLFSGSTEVASMAATGSVPITNTSIFRIGSIIYSINNFYHNGYIDEVSLWTKALSVTEISNIVTNNGEIATPLSESNLEAYYKFNQGISYGSNSGLITLNDEMGTYNATLSNFALSGTSSNWGSDSQMSTTNFDKNDFYAFPNPANSVLNLSGFSEKIALTIMDLTGRNVLHKKEINSTSIDISTLNNGVYIAQINGNIKIKFLKN